MFLKSNYEFLRRNYQKSIKLLNTAPKMNNHHETGDNIPCMYYNNQGCIHYQMQKYNLAALYFKKALEENDKVLMSLPPVDKSKLHHAILLTQVVLCAVIISSPS